MASKTYANPEVKPTGTVSNLTITRTSGSYALVAKWKVPSTLTDKKDAAGQKRTTSLKVDFILDLFRPGKAKDPADVIQHRTSVAVSTTEATINLNGFNVTKGSGSSQTTTSYHRDDFYPATNAMVASVTVKVWCVNSKGTADKCASATYKFRKPGKPKVSALTQTHDEGHIQLTITAYDGSKNANERYDTRYQIQRYDSRSSKQGWVAVDIGSFTPSKKEWTTSIDVAARMQLGYSDYIKYRARAMSRGFAGMSDGISGTTSSESKAWTAYKYTTVAYPALPTITSVKVSGKQTATDKVTVNINTNVDKPSSGSSPNHPVTGVRLQVLRSTQAATVAAATASADWSDTDTVDDGECKALSISVAEVSPDTGTHTWVRVKAWNEFEDLFYRFSAPVELTKLYESVKSEIDKIKITSVVAGDDGKSLVVNMVWKKVGDVDDTGTELSWSDDENAWRSTSGPQTYEFTWSDGATTHSGTAYTGSAAVHIQGLTEGTKYFVKARRYLETESSGTVYGDYTPTWDGIPASSPESVTLTAPSYIETGSDLDLSWTFESDAQQTSWEVITGTTQTTSETRTINGQTVTVKHLWIKQSGSKVIASGTDPTGATTIPAEWFDSQEHKNLIQRGGKLPLAVRVSTGGTPTDSEAKVVTLTERPYMLLEAPATLTAQPYSFDVYCPDQVALSAVIRAADGGCEGDTPTGTVTQPEGDVIWQASITPEWVDVSPVGNDNLVSNNPDMWGNSALFSGTVFSYNTYYQLACQKKSMRVIPVTPSQSYTASLSGDAIDTGWGSDGYRYKRGIGAIVCYDTNNNLISKTIYATRNTTGTYEVFTCGSTTQTWTAPANAAYVVFHVCTAGMYQWEEGGETLERSWNEVTDLTLIGDTLKVKVEEGSSATSWEPSYYDVPTYDGTMYKATITTPTEPDILAFLDNGNYELTVRGTDQTTGLTSDEITASIAVAWSHQAPVPSDAITVEPQDLIDVAGVHTRQCVIRLASPTSAATTDVYDVYRVTPDGAYLVQEGLTQDETVTDRYAPYGGSDMVYRIACRTADGDVDWADFWYSLRGTELRIDFGGNYVELPYDLTITDTYTKDFEPRQKLDGSIDGYWNDSVQRTGGFSSNLIRIYDEKRAETIRQLARYSGPVFVRTPGGCAYQANVNVSNFGGARKNAAIAVTLDASEVDLTQEFWASIPIPDTVTTP